jgi:hypothetical protein
VLVAHDGEAALELARTYGGARRAAELSRAQLRSAGCSSTSSREPSSVLAPRTS